MEHRKEETTVVSCERAYLRSASITSLVAGTENSPLASVPPEVNLPFGDVLRFGYVNRNNVPAWAAGARAEMVALAPISTERR